MSHPKQKGPSSSLLADFTEEEWQALYQALPRKAREEILAILGIRASKTASLVRLAQKQQEKRYKLQQALLTSPNEEVAESLLRFWLLQRRPLLGAALDWLGIPHKAGITDSDEVNRLADLTHGELASLWPQLLKVGTAREAEIYLRFMGCQQLASWLAEAKA